jgi:hypothetical protein
MAGRRVWGQHVWRTHPKPQKIPEIRLVQLAVFVYILSRKQTSVYRHIVCSGIPRRQRSRGKVSGTALLVFIPAFLGIRSRRPCRSSWLRNSSSGLRHVSWEIRNGAATDRLTGVDSGCSVILLRAGPRMRHRTDLAQGLISCLLTVTIRNSSFVCCIVSF